MASSVIGALRVNLGLDSAKFSKGLSGAQKSLNAARKQFLRVATVAAAVGGALTTLTVATSKTAAEIDRFSKVANASVGEFQKWSAGAKTVGVEQEKLADILKDVNDRVGDFLTTGGGPMADFFEKVAPKIGLTADAFRDLSGPQALQLYVSSLEKAGLSQQEMTFYLEAMASDATLLIPLLRDGGTEMARLGENARSLGGVMSDKTVASLNSFKLALGDTGTAIQGIGYRISGELAPALTALAIGFNDSMREGGSLRIMIDGLIANIDGLIANIDVLTATMGAAVVGFGVRYVKAFAMARGATGLLTGSLIVLRSVLMATFIGAVFVAIGYLIALFKDLVVATGGIGDAFALLGTLSAEVWERIGFTVKAFQNRFSGVMLNVRAAALDAWQNILDRAFAMANSLAGIAVGAKDAFIAAFNVLPEALGSLMFQAADKVVQGVEEMINKSLRHINNLIGAVKMLSALPGFGAARGLSQIDPLDFGGVGNPFAGAPGVGSSVQDAFSNAALGTYVGAAPQNAGQLAESLRGAAGSRENTANVWGDLATSSLTSLQALRDTIAETGDETETTIEEVDRMIAALNDVETAAGGGGGGSGGKGSGGSGGATGAIAGLNEEIANTDIENSGWGAFIDKMSDAITSANSMKEAFANMGDVIKSQLREIASTLLSSGLKTLFGGATGGGGLFGAISGMFGGGGGMGSAPPIRPFGGARAGGGDVLSSKGYMVGEQGPEWFSPKSSGNITPNHKLGGGSAPIFNINVSGARGNTEIRDMVEAGIRQAAPAIKQDTLKSAPAYMAEHSMRME